MLTIEKLKQDTTIAGANIPDTVLTAIANLSKNDEDGVVAARDGHIYGLVDQALNEVLGEAKPNGVKTTDFIRSKVATIKATADKAGNIAATEKERDELKTEVADLKKKITDGNTDEVTKKLLVQLEGKIRQKDADITTLKTAKESEVTELKTKLESEVTANLSLALQQQANEYFSGVKFDPKLPTWAVEAAKERAIAQVKANKGAPAWEGEGVNRQLVFRDAAGNVMKNPANQLQPYKFGELAGEYLKEAIVEGGGGGGGGTKNPGGGGSGGGGGSFSIAGLKSKVEVTAAIRAKLSEDGIPMTDPSYQQKFDEMYATEGVSALPTTAKQS